MSLKFSVMLPIYYKENAEYFNLALNSILNQTLMPNEILIIEDGRLSNELESIVMNAEQQYPNLVRVIRLEKNIGIGKVRALGVEECKHEYIALMDSDDISMIDRFAKQIPILEANNDIDMLGGQVTEFNDEPELICQKRIVPTAYEDVYKFCKLRNPTNNVTLIFKKSVALAVGNYNINVGFEDYELCAKFLNQGYKIVNIPDFLVNVRSGKRMMDKRKGLDYFFKYEYTCMKTFLDMGFINYWEFVRNLALKFPLRVMPNWMRTLVYKKFLRK